ncbi:MAG: hypothetical protein AB7Y46_14935 [Armatimonadota bacterium]
MDAASAPRTGDGHLLTPGEMAPVLAWALAMMALTAWPYLWAIEYAPVGMQFQGFIWGVDEGNVYLAWMRQAAEGRVLLRNQYTTLPQNPHFVNVFVLGLGRLAGLTGQHPGVVFHGARLVGGVVLLCATYLFAAFVSRSRAVRWATLALASLGSGLGWAAALWASTLPEYMAPPLRPHDYAPAPPHSWQVMPEAVTFLSLLLNPLFVWSMALMVGVLLAAAVALERRSVGWAALSGVLLLLVGNMHTYDVFALNGAIIAYYAVMVVARRARPRQAALSYVLIFLMGLPAPVYAWWTAQVDPAYMKKIMTETLSPPPLDLAMGYGLVLVLAVAGAVHAVRVRREHPRLLLPVCWAGVNLPLLYAPVPFQRKLAEGLHIPLCVLAAVALVTVIAPMLALPRGRQEPSAGILPVGARLRAAARRATASPGQVALLIVAAVVATVPSNVLFVAGCLDNVASNNRALLSVLQPPVYLSFDEVRALEFLASRASADDVVLCSSLLGSYVPVRAPCLVFAGHWAETLHFADAVSYIGQFLMPGRSARVLQGAVEQVDADWVIYGPQEALIATQMALAAGQEPPEDPAEQFRAATQGFLVGAFTRGDVAVYSVLPGAAPGAPIGSAPGSAAPEIPSAKPG